MDAIELLKSQHREVEDLFAQIQKAKNDNHKAKLFDKLADDLVVHASIEEHHFYPAVKERRTEDILLESLEEHLAIKRALADLLETAIDDKTFDAKIKALKEEVEHHVKEEENDLFPKVKKILSKEQLVGLASEMLAEQTELEEEGEPRKGIPGETDHPATI